MRSPTQFDPEQLKQLNKMIFPDTVDPFIMRILWLKMGDSNISAEEHGRIPHHHRFYEIHFYLEGEARYAVKKTDIFKIERNQFIIFPPNTLHEKTRSDPNSLRFSLAYEIPPQDGERTALASYLTCDRTFVGLIAPDMRDILMSISAELDFHSALTPVILRNLMFNVIYRVCRQDRSEERSDIKAELTKSIDQRVRGSIRFINDNLDMPLTALTVAEYSHISYKQLNRLFREELNTTVLRYIHEKKNERAKALLANDSLSLADIGRAVGFENEYYFNAFFKKMNGISPGAFRKERHPYSKKVED